MSGTFEKRQRSNFLAILLLWIENQVQCIKPGYNNAKTFPSDLISIKSSCCSHNLRHLHFPLVHTCGVQPQREIKVNLSNLTILCGLSAELGNF